MSCYRHPSECAVRSVCDASRTPQFGYGLSGHGGTHNEVRGIIHVRNKEGFHTKTYKDRIVSANELVIEALKNHQPHPVSSYIFYNYKGRPFTDIRGSFKSALKRANLPDITFHDMRHIYANVIALEMDVWSLIRILGHKDVRSSQVYVHVTDEQIIERAQAIKIGQNSS